MADRRATGSVRVRVTFVATAVVGATLVIGCVLVLVLLRNGLIRSVTGTGPHRAAEIGALAQTGRLSETLPALDTPRRTLLQLLDSGGRVLAASEPLRGAPPVVIGDSHRREVAELPGGLEGPWLVEPVAAVIAGRPATVVVATSVAGLTHPVDLLAGLFLLGMPFVLALVAGVAWIVVGRALRPVEAMRAQVADLTATSLDRRVPLPDGDDEIARLAHTLNGMLDRLQRSDEQQRRFVADASHELRTPLANMRTALEVAEATTASADWPDVAVELLGQTERMQRLIDDLLVLTRADAGEMHPGKEPVDVVALVTEVARAPRRVPIDLEATAAPVIVDGDRIQLASVVTNLVDNATRHAVTRVTVTVASLTSGVEITVSDDGPGVASADRERIFERFVRLDEHRDRSDGGAGVGLAIVRRVVAAHGGTARSVEPLGGIGARFVVQLPRR